MRFAPIPDVIAAIGRGEMVVLVDDEDRENEGDIVVAAEFADEKAIAFMATKACGLICVALDGTICDNLGLDPQAPRNQSRMGTAFTISIEAREGVTTGISAADRARTIAVAIDADAKPMDLVSPGHVFPLRAREGGVLVRAGQTEGGVDLARLAGLRPGAVICEIMKEDGSMARRNDLDVFCQQHRLLMCTVADLIAYRERQEKLVELVAETPVTTAQGPARAYSFRAKVSGQYHLALAFGDRLNPGVEQSDPVLVRVHKENLLADVFGTPQGPGRGALDQSLAQVADEGDGLILYLRDTVGRNLASQIEAGGGSVHHPEHFATPGMDNRDYGVGAQILRAMGVRKMRLITATDRNITALRGHGLQIVERVMPRGVAAT